MFSDESQWPLLFNLHLQCGLKSVSAKKGEGQIVETCLKTGTLKHRHTQTNARVEESKVRNQFFAKRGKGRPALQTKKQGPASLKNSEKKKKDKNV